MDAHVGDEIVMRPPGVGRPIRDGQIVEIAGPSGRPPYLVRWEDGRETLLYPGPDAVVRHQPGCPGDAPPRPAQG